MSKKDLKRLTAVLTLSAVLGTMEEPRKAEAAVGPLVASAAGFLHLVLPVAGGGANGRCGGQVSEH